MTGVQTCALPICQEITATEAECAALARRFELVSLDRLAAVVELERQGQDRVRLTAEFAADFVQNCVVTLDPVNGTVAERFALLYGPPEAEAEAGFSAEDELAFEPLAGDTIDLGEAVAQEFALALPPFPRIADANVETPPPPSDDARPFAALSRFFARGKS